MALHYSAVQAMVCQKRRLIPCFAKNKPIYNKPLGKQARTRNTGTRDAILVLLFVKPPGPSKKVASPPSN